MDLTSIGLIALILLFFVLILGILVLRIVRRRRAEAEEPARKPKKETGKLEGRSGSGIVVGGSAGAQRAASCRGPKKAVPA